MFSSCIEQLEANDVLLQRAADSLGSVERERKTPSGTQDWGAYRQEYLAAAFLSWLVGLLPPKPPSTQLVSVPYAGGDDVVVFGGGQ